MEPENNQSAQTAQTSSFGQLTKVTPVSKYLAMLLFILLPFLGAWVGYTYAPEKVVEIQGPAHLSKVSENIDVNEDNSSLHNNQSENLKTTDYKLVLELAPDLKQDNFGPWGVTTPARLYFSDGFNKKLVKTLPGDCQLSSGLTLDLLTLSGFSTEIFKSGVDCWYGGSGYTAALLVDSGKSEVTVIGQSVQECGDIEEKYCDAHGEIEYLLKQ